MSNLIELKPGDRVVQTRAGLRDRLFVAHDRFQRLLIISGAIPPLARTINRLATCDLDRVHHQSLYQLAHGKIKCNRHKGWRCEELRPDVREDRINELISDKWTQMGILTDDPDDWVIVRAGLEDTTSLT